MGFGRGIGYYNIAPMDSHVHSLSAKGIKQKKFFLVRTPSPNKALQLSDYLNKKNVDNFVFDVFNTRNVSVFGNPEDKKIRKILKNVGYKRADIVKRKKLNAKYHGVYFDKLFNEDDELLGEVKAIYSSPTSHFLNVRVEQNNKSIIIKGYWEEGDWIIVDKYRGHMSEEDENVLEQYVKDNFSG